MRRKEDLWNDLFGLAMIWPYYRFVLNHSESRLVLHNRIVGGSLAAAVVYATFIA